EQTTVPLHPSRCAHLVPAGPARSMVALRWSADSVSQRLANQDQMRQVAEKVQGSGKLTVVVLQEQALVRPADGSDPWVFAPNLGRTLEDELREQSLPADRRRDVV